MFLIHVNVTQFIYFLVKKYVSLSWHVAAMSSTGMHTSVISLLSCFHYKCSSGHSLIHIKYDTLGEWKYPAAMGKMKVKGSHYKQSDGFYNQCSSWWMNKALQLVFTWCFVALPCCAAVPASYRGLTYEQSRAEKGSQQAVGFPEPVSHFFEKNLMRGG